MSRASSPAFAIGGIEPAFSCIVCGADLVSIPIMESRGHCSDHCFDHDFEYDPYERGRFCIHCGLEEEWEPSEDDIGISFIDPDRDRPLGTPLSQISGRPGHPGYDEFCRIARSWGFE